MEVYLIRGETLAEIADRIRRMAGIREPMTAAEMAGWLKQVLYVPQGRATTALSDPITVKSECVGSLPAVARATAETTANLSQISIAASTAANHL